MTKDDYPADPSLTNEELVRVAALNPADIQLIDDALMANVDRQWRKVARVVMSAMIDLKKQGPRVSGIPDVYYAERVRELMHRGLVEGDGDFTRMGRSEIRLP